LDISGDRADFHKGRATVGEWQGRGMAWQGNGMGMVWARHGTCELALSVSYGHTVYLNKVGLLETWSNVKAHHVIQFMHVKEVALAKIYRQLVKVYGACVVQRKQLL
jgi:hypothetical protein